METEVLTPPLRPDSLREAVALLQEMPGPSLPIRDPDTGRVVAVLVRPQQYPPALPPRLGGMATPLGVYLTDGSVSGGAGFWGLFLTGLTLGAMALVAEAVVQALLTVLTAHGFNLWLWVASPSHSPALREWLSEALTWLPVPLIFLFLRFVPMSGTHAAEHQVVHCVEQNLPLVPDAVRRQPRVHPRCGTNYLVGLSLFLLVFIGVFVESRASGSGIGDSATLALVGAAVPTLFLWRRIGGFVQQWFATRPATEAQIRGAIRAAEEVLARRRTASISPRFFGLRRVWNMGFPQIILGYFALYAPLLLAYNLWPHLDRWLNFL